MKVHFDNTNSEGFEFKLRGKDHGTFKFSIVWQRGHSFTSEEVTYRGTFIAAKGLAKTYAKAVIPSADECIISVEDFQCSSDELISKAKE